jgi:hypothetical protein
LIERLVVRLIADNNDIGLSIMNQYGLPPLKLISPLPKDLNESSCTGNDLNTVCSPEYIIQINDGVLRVRFL